MNKKIDGKILFESFPFLFDIICRPKVKKRKILIDLSSKADKILKEKLDIHE